MSSGLKTKAICFLTKYRPMAKIANGIGALVSTHNSSFALIKFNMKAAKKLLGVEESGPHLPT
jgi:hypothetical protein